MEEMQRLMEENLNLSKQLAKVCTRYPVAPEPSPTSQESQQAVSVSSLFSTMPQQTVPHNPVGSHDLGTQAWTQAAPIIQVKRTSIVLYPDTSKQYTLESRQPPTSGIPSLPPARFGKWSANIVRFSWDY